MTNQPVQFARSFRRSKTDAEQKLWRELRDLAQSGLHFRQQAPIGRFITDFCEHTHKLIVEVDGSHHGLLPFAQPDIERTAWLESQGYRVIRFSNTEIFTRLEGVVIEIMIATGTLPADSSIVPDADPPTIQRNNRVRFAAVEAKRRRRRTTPSSVLFHPSAAATPSPLVGEGWGGGASATPNASANTPTPNSSPQGGGGFTASLTSDPGAASSKDRTS